MFAGAGFERHGTTWVRPDDDLSWLVRLDRAPFRSSCSLELGVAPRWLDRWADADRVHDCPLVIQLELLPLSSPAEVAGTRLEGFSTAVVASFDVRSTLPGDLRRRLWTAVLRAGAEYTASVRTPADLRRELDAGVFAAGFVHRDLREWLTTPPVA
ncbi:hypothetical protein [uncultured Cellulomonas sp.]|uniref:hypothetical protein n=1 Tax=uncultured Cellulomonas sp. TaxID=189682 RepID=UPI0028EDBB62|nr:hypothetical protein [uncultured Cellulomonas sp.]